MIDLDKLYSGSRICIIIRHGEKESADFRLTEKGKKDSAEFGRLLNLLDKQVVIYSSPEERCVETAYIIKENIKDINGNVNLSIILGKPGIQVKNEQVYNKLTNSMRCRDIYNMWKNGLVYDAMNCPDFIKTEMIKFLKKTSLNNGISLYISQSGTVACTGFSLGLLDTKANNEEWIDFLDGYIVRL